MPFAATTCIARRLVRLTATNDSEVMHSDSMMVTAAGAGDYLTSNEIWTVVLLDLLEFVGFRPLLQHEPRKTKRH